MRWFEIWWPLVTIGNLGGFDVIGAQTSDVEMIKGWQVNTTKVTLPCPADHSKLFLWNFVFLVKLSTVFLWFCQLHFSDFINCISLSFPHAGNQRVNTLLDKGQPLQLAGQEKLELFGNYQISRTLAAGWWEELKIIQKLSDFWSCNNSQQLHRAQPASTPTRTVSATS